MTPITQEKTAEKIGQTSFYRRIRTTYSKDNEDFCEGCSYLTSIGLLFPIIPLMFFVLFYYALFYIDIFTR
ncbi:MAG: hypothetical protein GPJ54_04120 [Candidatus Heimdallarchaeota archaeon]|nr:hypothetical protein [Candidatus Heimdallarchaeota archaeon]